jgi:hypothetical protein
LGAAGALLVAGIATAAPVAALDVDPIIDPVLEPLPPPPPPEPPTTTTLPPPPPPPDTTTTLPPPPPPPDTTTTLPPTTLPPTTNPPPPPPPPPPPDPTTTTAPPPPPDPTTTTAPSTPTTLPPDVPIIVFPPKVSLVPTTPSTGTPTVPLAPGTSESPSTVDTDTTDGPATTGTSEGPTTTAGAVVAGAELVPKVAVKTIAEALPADAEGGAALVDGRDEAISAEGVTARLIRTPAVGLSEESAAPAAAQESGADRGLPAPLSSPIGGVLVVALVSFVVAGSYCTWLLLFGRR